MVCSSFSDDDVRDIIRVVLSACRLGSEQGPPGEDIVRQVQEILWFLEAEKRMAARGISPRGQPETLYRK